MIGLLTKLLPTGIKVGMEIVKNRQQTKRLESVAEMKHMERMASGELEYKKAVIANNQQGWKDEFVLILVSAPVMILIWSIFSDDPAIWKRLISFLHNLTICLLVPSLVIGVVSAIYGLKGADIMKGQNNMYEH